MHIAPEDPREPISTKFGISGPLADLIMHANFLAIGLGVLNLWGVEFCHFPIFRRSPLTVLALPRSLTKSLRRKRRKLLLHGWIVVSRSQRGLSCSLTIRLRLLSACLLPLWRIKIYMCVFKTTRGSFQWEHYTGRYAKMSSKAGVFFVPCTNIPIDILLAGRWSVQRRSTGEDWLSAAKLLYFTSAKPLRT